LTIVVHAIHFIIGKYAKGDTSLERVVFAYFKEMGIALSIEQRTWQKR